MEQQTTSRGIARVVEDKLVQAGLSQRAAATETGIPLTTLHRRLSGQSPFTTDELEALSALLRTPISVLVAEAEVAA